MTFFIFGHTQDFCKKGGLFNLMKIQTTLTPMLYDRKEMFAYNEGQVLKLF